MLLSVFTPTHNPRHLRQAYLSLVAQRHYDWEWVIVPNNGISEADVMSLLGNPSDKRIRIVPYSGELSTNIGSLKRFACNQLTGDVFIELDHDDWLLPECLDQIANAVDSGADFVFSDSIHYNEDGKSNVFGKDFGWQHYPACVNSVNYTVNKSMPVTPRSLMEIYYAPDHVRAWTREMYFKAGGHNVALPVGDDHELVCKTYIAGADMYYISKPLYMYRESGKENTYMKNHEKIREISVSHGYRFLRPMVDEWCRRNNYPKIDMGAARAFNKQPGYLNLDVRADNLVDIVHDANEPLPFADSSVGVFRCQDFLEHVPIGKVVPLMNEFYRCLVPGGWLMTCTPSTDGRGAFQDPTHVSFWNSNSFWYYTQFNYMSMVPEITCKFQTAQVKNHYINKYCENHHIMHVVADLIAMKGQQQIGPVNHNPPPPLVAMPDKFPKQS